VLLIRRVPDMGSNAGVSAKTIGFATVVWLALMQLISASVGGNVAGRLRTKWIRVHTDEVFVRDTAHGFLVGSVAFVMTASFLTSVATSLVERRSETGRGNACCWRRWGGVIVGPSGYRRCIDSRGARTHLHCRLSQCVSSRLLLCPTSLQLSLCPPV
jgi:hypothetical protein